MFDAVQILCQSRGQSLVICYNHMDCDNNGHQLNRSVNLGLGTPIPWQSANTEENQIVYGHGLGAGFEKFWGLSSSPRHAWIRVLRDPVSTLISLWSFKQRVKFTNLTLNEWVDSGNAEACIDMYFAYLVDLGGLDPSGCHWTNAKPNAKQIVKIQDASMLNAAADALVASNSLVLMHGMTEFNLHRLSTFLELSPEEVELMSDSLSSPTNSAPPQELSLLKSNLERLESAAEPLQFVLDEVRRRGQGASSEISLASSKVQVVSQEASEVTIHVSLD